MSAMAIISPSTVWRRAQPPLLFLSLPFQGPTFGRAQYRQSISLYRSTPERWWDEGVIYRKEWVLWHPEQAHFTS
jgi:hypothetical protein